MRSRYLAATASVFHVARAIPAYITTVFNCPDAVTITQTVYPPGWTNTGPIYAGMSSNGGEGGGLQSQQTQANAAVTTSWETGYATTVVSFSEMGMYTGVAGCPSEIIAYMPTTVTCSEAVSTGWVGYVDDIACQSCTITTLAAIKPTYNTTSSSTVTYVTIWTEAYSEVGTSTHASLVGQPITTNIIPSNIVPYTRTVSAGSGPTANPSNTGGGSQPSLTGGAYPSMNFNDPNNFKQGSSIPIQSAGYSSTAGSNPPAQTGATDGGNGGGLPYTWTTGVYPSIDFQNSKVFREGSEIPIVAASKTFFPGGGNGGVAPLTMQISTPAPTASPGATSATNAGQYSINFSDPNQFRQGSSIPIVSATGPPSSQPAPTETYTVPTSYTSNYASIDANASSNFKPPTSPVSIVSATEKITKATPTTTVTYDPNSTKQVNYPTIDFSNPTVFQGMSGSLAAATASKK